MNWQILAKIKATDQAGRREEIISRILANRGLKTKKQKEDFENPQPPHKLSVRDLGLDKAELKKALARVKKALKKREKIIVWGDFDADGVCATAIMWEALHTVGADSLPFIPQRSEGYGLKTKKIRELAKNKTSLIITVDQGIVGEKQIKFAQGLGVDVIVTDHHALGKTKPKATAIIHTTKLSGAGVAWFFTLFLLKEFNRQPSSLDLATIGTIADVVPLIGSNRSLVKYGLKELTTTTRIGLNYLIKTAGIEKSKIGSFEVGFMLGPRINAAGRLSDPMDSLRLLCLRTDHGRADSLSRQLDENNKERQLLTGETHLHAKTLWLKKKETNSLIFIEDKSYNHGIIGLVASKLTEEFYLPSVVIAKGEKESRGSARSIAEFNMIKAIQKCGHLLKEYGGHPLAAGFTLETQKLNQFRKALIRLANEELAGLDLKPLLLIDAELTFQDLKPSLWQELKKLAPFGEGNKEPIFASKNISVSHARLVGVDNKHLKLQLVESDNRQSFEAIGFGLGKKYAQLTPEAKYDIAYSLQENNWQNQKKLELRLRDLKKA